MLGAICDRHRHRSPTKMKPRLLRVSERPFAHALGHEEEGEELCGFLFDGRWTAGKPQPVRFADNRISGNIVPEDFSDVAGGFPFGPQLFERIHHSLGPCHRNALSYWVARIAWPGVSSTGINAGAAARRPASPSAWGRRLFARSVSRPASRQLVTSAGLFALGRFSSTTKVFGFFVRGTECRWPLPWVNEAKNFGPSWASFSDS